MPSRQARREKASQFVEVTAVHENIQWDFVRLLDALISDPIISQSELMREFLIVIQYCFWGEPSFEANEAHC